MLQIMLNHDDSDPVTYDILREETENGKMAKSFDSWFTSHGDVSFKPFDNGSIKGFVYQSDVVITAGYDGKFECLVFPSEDDNSWIFVALVETNNTEFIYFSDFEKILDAITVSNL